MWSSHQSTDHLWPDHTSSINQAALCVPTLFSYLSASAWPVSVYDDITLTSGWRHSERDGVSNHQRLDSLLNRLFRRGSKKTSKPRVTGLCGGNSQVTDEFSAQRASNVGNVSILLRHYDDFKKCVIYFCYVPWALRRFKSPATQLFVDQLVQGCGIVCFLECSLTQGIFDQNLPKSHANGFMTKELSSFRGMFFDKNSKPLVSDRKPDPHNPSSCCSEDVFEQNQVSSYIQLRTVSA